MQQITTNPTTQMELFSYLVRMRIDTSIGLPGGSGSTGAGGPESFISTGKMHSLNLPSGQSWKDCLT